MNSTFNVGPGDGAVEFGSKNSSSVSRKFSSLAPFFKTGILLGVPVIDGPIKNKTYNNSLRAKFPILETSTQYFFLSNK